MRKGYNKPSYQPRSCAVCLDSGLCVFRNVASLLNVYRLACSVVNVNNSFMKKAATFDCSKQPKQERLMNATLLSHCSQLRNAKSLTDVGQGQR